MNEQQMFRRSSLSVWKWNNPTISAGVVDLTRPVFQGAATGLCRLRKKVFDERIADRNFCRG